MYSLFHLLGLHKVMKYTTFRLSIYTKEYSHPTLKKIKTKDLLSLFCQSGYNPVEAKIIYTYHNNNYDQINLYIIINLI